MKRTASCLRGAAGAWLICALWMAVIFLASAQTGEASGGQSGALAQMVMDALCALFGAVNLPEETVEWLLRKGAHMAEYAVLFVLSRRAFVRSGALRPGLYALMLCAGYACTDEWHQAFVPGRGPSIRDVMIDTLGALTAWGAYALRDRRMETR